jgi:hypothetical protein
MTTMTRDEAIAMLVDLDVAKWGEGEREASRRSHASRSHGRAVNEVANRWMLSGDPALEAKGEALAKAAKKLLTSSDISDLRQGG